MRQFSDTLPVVIYVTRLGYNDAMDGFREWPKKFYGPPDVRGGPSDDSSGDDEHFDKGEPRLDEMPGVYSDIKTKRTIYNELETPEPALGDRRRTTVDRNAKFTQFSEEWLNHLVANNKRHRNPSGR